MVPQILEVTPLRIGVISSELPIIAPEITSPCPLIYLVQLCKTISAPSFNGYTSGGGVKVLSTATRTPFSCANLEIPAISVNSIVGFVNVSK